MEIIDAQQFAFWDEFYQKQGYLRLQRIMDQMHAATRPHDATWIIWATARINYLKAMDLIDPEGGYK